MEANEDTTQAGERHVDSEERCRLDDQLQNALSWSVPKITDDHALQAIAWMLTDPEWGVGMLEDIADIVRKTGRVIKDVVDEELGEPICTWVRH